MEGQIPKVDSLDSFGRKENILPATATTNNNDGSSGTVVNYLKIDHAGSEYDALLGGKDMLQNVEYLEFGYHYVGPWGKQSLPEAIGYLEENFGFTCYWPGNGELWRITGCLLDDVYATHFWSEIACVNHQLNPVLQDIMETKFLQTIGKKIQKKKNKRANKTPPKNY